MLDVEDPYLGYDAENFPYKPPQRGIRPTFRTGLLGRLCGNICAPRSLMMKWEEIPTGFIKKPASRWG